MWHSVSGRVIPGVWKDQCVSVFKVMQSMNNGTTTIFRNVEKHSPEDTVSRLGRLEASDTQLWESRGFLQSYFNSWANECVFEFIWTTKHNNNNKYNNNNTQ